MPVEDAADLAGMFDADEHGTAATYRPAAGGSTAVEVILDRPSESWGGVGPSSLGVVAAATLPAAALAARPVAGDQIDIGATTYRVAEVMQDGTGRVLTLHLRKAP
jgi:hypothetical protein